MRHRIPLAASLVYLVAANILWIAMDTRPPFWDMANHARWAMGVLRDFEQNGVGGFLTLPDKTSGYPPLYYVIVALNYRLLGLSIDAAQLANIPAMILLSLSTYGIARHVLQEKAAALAGILVNFFPFMIWISRETLLEYWLSAMVAASIWALLKTEGFANTRWSLLFGVVCGLGMLTKWTFVLFVGPPAVWAARKHLGNAVKAAVLAVILTSLWYIPQFPTLFTSWQVATIGGQNEGDPARFSLQAWLFYIRALEGSLLFLPLFVVFLAGLLVLVRNWQTNFPKWTPIVLCVFGGWLGLLFLPNQDPRYAVAALPAVAVITAGLFEGKTRARMALAAFLVLQHILVSFGIPQLPERVVLRKGPEAPVRYDWNLYTQSYFGLWGKPEVQDWKIEHVLRRVSENSPEPAHIALIPDLPRFDVPAFQFTIDRDRYPVSIAYPSSADLSEILKSDFLLMSLGRQAAFGLRAPYAQEINDYILARPDQFPLADSFPLPDGEIIRLYQHARQP